MAKILVLDIEVLPAKCLVYDLRTTYVNKSMILEPRRTCLICAKWVDDDEVFTFAEWDAGGHQGMLDGIWALMDSADCCVTFNGDAYDLKELGTAFVLAGMEAPSPFISIDLYKAAKRRFRFMSSSLQYVADALNTTYRKLDSGGIEIVKRIMDGDEEAREEYAVYCAGDVLATDELYKRLFSYLPKALNRALVDGTSDPCCPACLSENYVKAGYTLLTTGKYRRFRCSDCKRYFRARTRIAAAEYREVTG